MNKHIDTLLQKEMSRQEFVKTLGLGLVSLFGLSSLVKLLSNTDYSQHKNNSVQMGYGSSPYGGEKESV